MAVTERGRDTARIAIKVVIFFIVPFGLLYSLHSLGLVPASRQWDVEPDPSKPTVAEMIVSGLYFVLLFVTFVLPLLVLRRELQKRRARK